MNLAILVGLHWACLINRATKHIHDAAQRALTNRYRDALAGIVHEHAATQAIRGAHGNGADHAVADLLLHLEGQAFFNQGVLC